MTDDDVDDTESEFETTDSPDESRPDPLADLASRARAQSDEPSDEDRLDDLFDSESVPDIDSDRLWSQLEDDDGVDTSFLDADRETREIDKHQYCHRCEHFDEPPSVGCRNDGTEILEFPSLETVRVVNCPVVLEEERLEGREG
ncbi:hypothetical protein ACLI4Z_06085 [Natrialbaceae archaeon A-arb3/5]